MRERDFFDTTVDIIESWKTPLFTINIIIIIVV